MDISDKLVQANIGSVNYGLDFMIGSLCVFSSQEEFEKGQYHFSINSRTRMPQEEWLRLNYAVIGFDHVFGDPFVVKTDEKNLTVYEMRHDDWNSLYLISGSLDDFIACLKLLKSECEKEYAGTQFRLLKQRLMEINKQTYSFYWKALVDNIEAAVLEQSMFEMRRVY